MAAKRRFALIAAGLVLAGCSSAQTPATPRVTASSTPTSAHSAPAATSSPTTPDLTQFTPAPSGAVNDDTGETIGATAPPVWDGTSRDAATAVATTVMTAFARPAVSQKQWWADLEPLLTAQAQRDYAYVDPANVPAAAVTGAASIVDASSVYVARVEVPTDVGTYTVVLSRAGAGSAWLTERITPPAGVH